MTTTAPLTKLVGEAERSLRTLLQRHLDGAGLTFPQWTTLVTLDNAGSMTTDQVVARQLAGHVVADARSALDAISGLHASGMIAESTDSDRATGARRHLASWEISPTGRACFEPLRAAIGGIVADLTRGLPQRDLEVTARTLATVGERATRHLHAAQARTAIDVVTPD